MNLLNRKTGKLYRKHSSRIFQDIAPGTPGRRAARRLNDGRVALALKKAEDPKHQMKFVHPRSLRLSSGF